MKKPLINKIVNTAIESLFNKQPDIFDYTSETNQTEWNLAHHLANEIHKFFPDLSCDIDVTKVNFENRRPDIILHKRGNNKRNLLVVEMKKAGQKSGIQSDIKKIKSCWFSAPLYYKFGVIVDIKTNKNYYVKVFENHAR